MAYVPPGSRPPGSPQSGPVSALLKLLIWVTMILIAIPAVAYGLFLAAVLIISAIYGPVRWN